MDQSKLRGNRKERGFTLIELMLVIVILGILAGVAVTNLTSVGEDARKARVKTDIETIQNAVRMFEIATGAYPTDDQGIDELTLKTDEHKAFLTKPPKDAWGETYNYRSESEHGQDFPDIWSNGKDKQEGTDDDIGNWDTEPSTGGGESTSGGEGGGEK
jgi:general secretion pathway protein G